MYNAFEPFVNLNNANLALFHRFANSADITRLVQNTVSRAFTLPQESLTKASQTNAFNEWTQGLADNFARFTQEYVNGFTQSMARTQHFVSQQVEQGRQFAAITEATEQETDETAETGRRSSKTRGRRNSK